jgi:hypothetical protein
MVYVGFKFQSDLAGSQRLANDEYQISLEIQKHPEITDVKGFKYNYFETINYYTGRNVSYIQDGDSLTKPTLIVSYSIPYKSHWFTPELMTHFEPLYVGDDVALLLYRP